MCCSLACSCAFTRRNQVRAAARSYQVGVRQLVASGRYDTRDDFTVVYQPFLEDAAPPANVRLCHALQHKILLTVIAKRWRCTSFFLNSKTEIMICRTSHPTASTSARRHTDSLPRLSGTQWSVTFTQARTVRYSAQQLRLLQHIIQQISQREKTIRYLFFFWTVWTCRKQANRLATERHAAVSQSSA